MGDTGFEYVLLAPRNSDFPTISPINGVPLVTMATHGIRC